MTDKTCDRCEHFQPVNDDHWKPTDCQMNQAPAYSEEAGGWTVCGGCPLFSGRWRIAA